MFTEVTSDFLGCLGFDYLLGIPWIRFLAMLKNPVSRGVKSTEVEEHWYFLVLVLAQKIGCLRGHS